MNLSETIKDCMDRFPALYPNRTHVLRHLFTGPENGFSWIDGELVEDDRSRSGISLEEYVDKEEEQLRHSAGNIGPHMELFLAAKKAKVLNRFYAAADKDCSAFPPIIKSSKISDIPRNITDSWIDGIYDVCQLLINADNPINQEIAKTTLHLC